MRFSVIPSHRATRAGWLVAEEELTRSSHWTRHSEKSMSPRGKVGAEKVAERMWLEGKASSQRGTVLVQERPILNRGIDLQS